MNMYLGNEKVAKFILYCGFLVIVHGHRNMYSYCYPYAGVCVYTLTIDELRF